MDDSQKRSLRRTAKWLHWIAQSILVVFIILRFTAPVMLKKAGEAMMTGDVTIKLLEPERVYSDLQLKSAIEKTDRLTNYPPPLDKTDLTTWGKAVADHMDQSCAVFYFDGDKSVQWPVVDKRLTGATKLVDEHLLSTATCVPDSPMVFQFGSFYLERGNFDSTQIDLSDFKSDHVSIAYIGRADSPERWGVVYSMLEAFKTFVDKLSHANDEGNVRDHDLRLLKELFHMPKAGDRAFAEKYGTSKYGLRVFDNANGSLAFSTPDLDTTNHKVDMKVASMPYWWEVYNNDRDEEWRAEFESIVNDKAPPWYGWIVDLILMVLIAMLYRTVLKTTEPE